MNDLVQLPEAALPIADSGALARLSELTTCAASFRDIEDCVSQLVALVARIFEARTCAILLVRADGEGMQTFSNHGRSVDRAAAEGIAHARRAAVRVLESGRPTLLAAPPQDSSPAAAAPIWVDGAIVGAIGVVGPLRPMPYGAPDLRLLEIVTRFIDKSIEVIQLRCLLNSRFAQLAVLREAGVRAIDQMPAAGRNPDELARLIARSFYREMARAGFCSRQIISAATEIISQLSSNIRASRSPAGPMSDGKINPRDNRVLRADAGRVRPPGGPASKQRCHTKGSSWEHD